MQRHYVLHEQLTYLKLLLESGAIAINISGLLNPKKLGNF
jgi:hypothetical protein